MKIMKKAAAVLVAALMAMSMTACGNGNGGNGTSADKKVDASEIAAKVGKTNIYVDELESYKAQLDYQAQMYLGADYKYTQEGVDQFNAMLDQYVENLVQMEIVFQEAEKNKDIKVTDEEVQSAFEEEKAQFSSEDDFNAALASSVYATEDVFKHDYIYKNLNIQKLLNTYQEGQQVTDDEIKAYYDENIAQYTEPAGIDISHILISFDSHDGDEAATKEAIDGIAQKLKDGADFAELAKEVSDDPGSAAQGGELGHYEKGYDGFVPGFMEAAEALEVGEVSDPVKTDYGYHIIKVTGKTTEDTVKTLDEVKEEIKTTLQGQKAAEAFQADIEKWEKEYDVKKFPENYHIKVEQAPETTPGATGTATDDANAANTEATPAATGDANAANTETTPAATGDANAANTEATPEATESNTAEESPVATETTAE